MEQITLASFFREGGFTRYVRRMRQVYKKRQVAMMDVLLTHHFDKHFRLYGTDTGLHVFLEGTSDFDEQGTIEAAKAAGVGIYPLSPYCYKAKGKGCCLVLPVQMKPRGTPIKANTAHLKKPRSLSSRLFNVIAERFPLLQ